MSATTQAAHAAHRFGLGEPDLSTIGTDPQAWLLSQIGPADPQAGPGGARLHGTEDALKIHQDARRLASPEGRDALRELIQADLRARLATAATTRRPFAERLALFWANHFTVSLLKGTVRGLVGTFEREAIRPHIAGRFAELLSAAVRHPAMLRYLDNQRSAGPNSRIVERLQRRSARAPDAGAPRLTGLNENLARELLELHTLGAAHAAGAYGPWGGYNQADVTRLAAVLTGWRDTFDADWHEPGEKWVLGQRYAEGPQALDAIVSDLARHPSTARHIATKLAQHFCADRPDPELVNRLATRFTETDGDLTAVYRVLVTAPQAWQTPETKLKTPEEFVVSSARLLRLGDRLLGRGPDAGLAAMGQRLHATPSPAGWPDRAEEWLGPEAVWQRIEWAARLSDRVGSGVDARRLAASALGPLLRDETRRQIDRAADAPQALALLLMSPEFQRR